MKASEVKEKSVNELKELGEKLEQEVFHLRFKKGAGQLKQTSSIRKARRDLARVKTFLRANEIKARKENV